MVSRVLGFINWKSSTKPINDSIGLNWFIGFICFIQPQNWFNLVAQLCYGASFSPFKLSVIMTISWFGWRHAHWLLWLPLEVVDLVVIPVITSFNVFINCRLKIEIFSYLVLSEKETWFSYLNLSEMETWFLIALFIAVLARLR